MSGSCCRRRGMGRVSGFIRWAVPGVILALMPKCPMCFAAYLALASGVGLSLPVAAVVQKILVIVCFVSLVFLTYRKIRRLVCQRAMRS